MVFAVGDVENLVSHIDGVRPVELAFERLIAIGTIAALAGARSRRNDACPQIDLSDDVILTIRHVHRVPVLGYAKSFGSGQTSRRRRAESGRHGRSAVAGVPALAVPCNAFQPAVFGIELEYAIALAQRDVDFPGP